MSQRIVSESELPGRSGGATEVHRVNGPQRWQTPHGPEMSDADVAFLKTRRPFRDLDPKSFSRGTPLAGILKYDTDIRRVEAGEILVRRGDYGNCAYLILAGSVTLLGTAPRNGPDDRFAAAEYSRIDSENVPAKRSPKIPSVFQRLRDCFRTHRFAEVRRPEQIAAPHVLPAGVLPAGDATGARLGRVDQRPTMFLQDCDAVLSRAGNSDIGPGELFGEVAAMYRTPHATTVVANTEATILEITWQGLRELRRDATFCAALDDHYRANWLPVHLRESPLLRFLSAENISTIAAATQLRSYGRLEWYADYRKTKHLDPREQIAAEPVVAAEGKFPTELLIVRSGFGRLSVDFGDSVRTSAYLGVGHTFGLDEVVENCLNPDPPRPLQQTLRAVGMLDVLGIPIEVFAETVLPHLRKSDLPEHLRSLFKQSHPAGRRRELVEPKSKTAFEQRSSPDRRSGSNVSTHSGPGGKNSPADNVQSGGQSFESTAMLEFVVGHRLNNAAAAMVIDLHRCTGCDDCVRACATTHGGNPRFDRSGPVQGRLQFASACMHCSDPVCMIGCPTGAITRDAGDQLVLIDESTCIGCSVCSAACPYQNIRMVDVVDLSGQQFIDAETEKPIRKATKCDLCRDVSGGPACVSACPHDALVRIDLSQSPPLHEFLRSRQ